MLKLITILAFLTGCERDPLNRPQTDLFVADLKIAPNHLSELETTVAGKNEVPAVLESKHRGIWRGLISYSGKSSLYHRKRGYQAVGIEGKFLGYKNFRLSAQVSDPSLLRNVLTFEVYASMGMPVPHTEFIELYLNNNFQGLYLMIEEVDLDFFKKRGVSVSSIYKARFGRLGAADLSLSSINKLNIGYNVVIGDERMFDLQDLIFGIQEFQKNRDHGVLDWNETIRYHAVSVFLKHWDGFKNNYILYRSQKSPQFHWTPWDGDQILQNPLYPGSFNSNNALWGFNEISMTILKNKSLCLYYLEQLEKLAQTFSSETIKKTLLEKAATIASSYRSDPFLRQKNLDDEINSLVDTAKNWQLLLSEKRSPAPCQTE